MASGAHKAVSESHLVPMALNMRTADNGQRSIMTNDFDTEDDGDSLVFIIIGRVFRFKGDEPTDIHMILASPDDDTAVRNALNALAAEGYEEADLDQIGVMEAMPDDEPHASAYQGALEGEIAIITM